MISSITLEKAVSLTHAREEVSYWIKSPSSRNLPSACKKQARHNGHPLCSNDSLSSVASENDDAGGDTANGSSDANRSFLTDFCMELGDVNEFSI